MRSSNLSRSRASEVRKKVTLSFSPADMPKVRALVAHELKRQGWRASLWSPSSALYIVVMRAAEAIAPPAGQPGQAPASSRPAGQPSRSRSQGRKVRS